MSHSTTSAPPADLGDLAAQMAAHEGLVSWVARRQRRGPLTFADALHAGRIGLWHALQGYDPTHGTRFSSYAVPCIARAIWDAVAAAATPPLPIATPASACIDATDPTEVLHRAQVRAALHALVAALPTRLRAVIVWHYGLDGTAPQTFAVIGQCWGISRQRVHQLHQQALLRLAHPATSGPLRTVLDRQQRSDYQRTLARQRQSARAARRGRR